MVRRRPQSRLLVTVFVVSLAVVSLTGCVPAVIAAACVGTCAIATAVTAVATREPSVALTLQVEGLSDGPSANAIEGALMKIDGVRDAKVDRSKGRVMVSYVESKVTQKQLVDAVNELGYSARLATAGDQAVRAVEGAR